MARKVFTCLGIFVLCFFCVCGTDSRQTVAAGAKVKITSNQSTVKKGDTVYVVITVSSSTALSGFLGYFSYDSRVLQYVTGGSVTSGNDDYFKIEDTDRTESATKLTYSVKFIARKKGSCTVTLKEDYEITADDDSSTKMSVSYTPLDITVTGKNAGENKSELSDLEPEQSQDLPEKESDAPKEEAFAKEKTAPAQRLPGDVAGSNLLRSLQVEGADLAPEFSPEINQYSAIVTTDEEELAVAYEAEDSLAKVAVKGNEEIEEGKNNIRVVVTGTNGEKNVYRLSVTVQRSADKEPAAEITLQEKDGVSYLEGSLRIELLTPDSQDIPSGFTETKLTVDGKTITAYALENVEESNFVLVYGRGDEEGFYLLDQKENLLMPYDRVKAWYRSASGESAAESADRERQSYRLILIIMGVFCALMLLLMLTAQLRARRARKSVGELLQREQEREE